MKRGMAHFAILLKSSLSATLGGASSFELETVPMGTRTLGFANEGPWVNEATKRARSALFWRAVMFTEKVRSIDWLRSKSDLSTDLRTPLGAKQPR